MNARSVGEARVAISRGGVITAMRSSAVLICMLVAAASGFHASGFAARHAARPDITSPLTLLRCAEGSGKGFGSASSPQPKKKKRKNAAAVAARTVAQQAAQGIASAAPAASSPDMEMITAEERGRAALEAMRKSSGTDPSLQLKKRGMMLTPEEMAPEEDSTMPPAVADRMLKRIIPFAALPVVGGILLFVAFYFATTQLEIDVPPTIVAYATQAMLLLSFGGITYGVMSTQLDEDAEQSALGVDNVKRNFDLMRGVEDERIAQTKEYEELLDAKARGIVMSPEEAREIEEKNAANRGK